MFACACRDEEEDGEYEPPMIRTSHLIACVGVHFSHSRFQFAANPVCEEVGCGEWRPPKIQNPTFKGKWKPSLIENPDYNVSVCLSLSVCLTLTWPAAGEMGPTKDR